MVLVTHLMPSVDIAQCRACVEHTAVASVRIQDVWGDGDTVKPRLLDAPTVVYPLL